MTSCAATTTIREALEWANGDLFEPKGMDAGDKALAALASLEQLVEAAQAVVDSRRDDLRIGIVRPEIMDAFAAALAAVGPGQETAP